MFENLVKQPITKQLVDDIVQNNLPPSILFSGNECLGKLTTALELARVLCCENDASWQCNCPSCSRHKELISSDLLILGTRDLSLEIKAAANTLLNDITISSRYLFLRSIRKLTNRFDARLWDTDEQRFLKAAPIVAELEEALSDLTFLDIEKIELVALKKKVDVLITKAEKLQDDCMYDSIPINQVRKASAWIRLMPTGKKKVLIIENADKMQDSARNAFLKILEEPPSYAVFILTTSHRGAIMPTILSRVRTYNFGERDVESQNEVIRRVFKDKSFACNNIERFNILTSYLYSFLPVEFSVIQNIATCFYSFSFKLANMENRKILPALYNCVIKYMNDNNLNDMQISEMVIALNKFKPKTIYNLFLNCLLLFLQSSLKSGNCSPTETECYFKITNLVRNSEMAVNTFNISAQATLENLVEQIKDAML